MKRCSKIFFVVLTTVFLLGGGTTVFADGVYQVNMALNPDPVDGQKMYIAIRSDCDFKGHFDIEPESLIAPGYDDTIMCATGFCMPDYTCMVNCSLQVVASLGLGDSAIFHVDIYDSLNQIVGSSNDTLVVMSYETLDDNYFGYADDCPHYVPIVVSTDPEFDFCMWLCHRTFVIPIDCHEPLTGVPMFRIRPNCNQHSSIDPGHNYSYCSYDTCDHGIADETVLSWHVDIIDTNLCIAFLVVVYCDAAPGCACLTAPNWILPVELTAFNAVAGDGYVDLTWTTASEENNSHFNIWRRSDSQSWMIIARDIPGHGTTNEIHQYTYRDASVDNGATYEYSLESVDINGERHTYGRIIAATPHVTEVPTAYELRQNFPNPFNASTAFEFALPEGGFVSLKIHDLLGREVATLAERNMEAGQHHITWNADGLPSGIYLYTLKAGDFVQTRKMLFLK